MIKNFLKMFILAPKYVKDLNQFKHGKLMRKYLFKSLISTCKKSSCLCGCAHRGFLLIELLVALFLVGILSFIVTGYSVKFMQNISDSKQRYQVAKTAHQILDYISSTKNVSSADVMDGCDIPNGFVCSWGKQDIYVFDKKLSKVVLLIKWKDFQKKEQCYEIQTTF